MGLLSFLRELADGGGTADDKLVHQELEQVRQMAEAAERGEEMADGYVLGPKIRRRYHFVGSVQGVGFRFTTTNLASAVGATGWVRNEHDGSVTVEVQGIVEQIDAVIAGLNRYYNGSRWLGGFTIDDVKDIPVVDQEFGFEPLY
ncbi:MAG: acylphosphatase [Atopobiaceae bacterium]|nr:acylphosphatase [Atopobiaceae bacterium]